MVATFATPQPYTDCLLTISTHRLDILGAAPLSPEAARGGVRRLMSFARAAPPLVASGTVANSTTLWVTPLYSSCCTIQSAAASLLSHPYSEHARCAVSTKEGSRKLCLFC